MTTSAPDRTFSLAMAGEDDVVRIVAIRGGPALARRAAAIGLNVGCELRVVQRQGPGIIVARGEARLALGAGMAHRVIVSLT